MILKRFFFPGGEGTFCFCFCFFDGKCELFLIPNGYFWSKEGWQHWHIPSGKGPWVSEGLLELRLRNLALIISSAGTINDYRLHLFSKPRANCGVLPLPLTETILTLLSHPMIMSANLALPFARGCRKRRMCPGRLFGWEGAERCLLEKRRNL